MNERPDPNRRNPGQSRTGTFKLNIDERDMMTGSYDPVGRGEERPYAQSSSGSRHAAYLTEEERRKEKKAARKRNRIKARKNKRVFKIVWVCMVLLMSFTVAAYLITGSNDFLGASRNPGTTKVEIPEKPTATELANILYEHGAISKPEFFALYCTVKDEMEYFSPGTFELDTDMDYEDLINTLQGGNDSREVVTVTFPEGINVLEAAQLLEENEVCTAQEFLAEVNSGNYSNYDMIGALDNLPDRYYDLEGYLFPDTYDFYKDEDLDSVVGKLLHNFQVRLSDSTRSMIAQSGMTVDQVVTMASIIQAEAANQNDMYDVSAVLHNRLEYGADYDIYWLQCDSTVYYPYREAEDVPVEGALSYGAYNTYEITGLPAGPICNPGADAIMAALSPNTQNGASEYLYFCHAEDGTAYYATSAADHQYNLQLAGLA